MTDTLAHIAKYIDEWESEDCHVTAIELPPDMYDDIIGTVYYGREEPEEFTVYGRDIHINPEISDIVVKDFET